MLVVSDIYAPYNQFFCFAYYRWEIFKKEVSNWGTEIKGRATAAENGY